METRKPLTPAEPCIDWEQRRYEIAKAVYPEIVKETHPRDAARAGNVAVMFADLLIEALNG